MRVACNNRAMASRLNPMKIIPEISSRDTRKVRRKGSTDATKLWYNLQRQPTTVALR
jgi:hypothetical protein